jgi:hypothetical protein
MAPRIFRDAVTPKFIPLNTDGVFAYVNGDYTWSFIDLDRFVRAKKQVARIDVIGNAWMKAAVLDVERYDATPQKAKDWIPQRNKFRGDATIYCGRANLDELFAACMGEMYWLLIADWTGAPHECDIPMPPGVRQIGTQYVSTPDWDASSIYADEWHPVRQPARRM